MTKAFIPPIVITDFANQYRDLFVELRDAQTSLSSKNDEWPLLYYEDYSDIEGTNSYCDQAAGLIIKERMRAQAVRGIHLFGSGNYHYMSYFWLKKIKTDFALVLFDNHPDLQSASFPGLLSCGSWVKDALSDISHLKEVYMCGVQPLLLQEAVKALDAKTKPVNPMDEMGVTKIAKGNLPLYISIDKDVLSPDYAACDWDQGTMTWQNLKKSLLALFENHTVIGVDICGDKKYSPSAEEMAQNEDINRKLLHLLTNEVHWDMPGKSLSVTD